MKSNLIVPILITGIVALLLVHYFLGMDYKRKSLIQEALTAQVSEASQTLAGITPPPRDLDQKMAAARASLAVAQNTLPRDINSTVMINSILKLADACEVKAIPLATRPWTKENTGSSYYVFRISMAVKGGFVPLSTFISQLENGELESLVVENLKVASVEDSSQTNASVQASLDLAIYSQFTTPS